MTLRMWNSSKAVNPTGSASYRPSIGGTVDWRNGIEWEASLIDKSRQGLVLVSADVLVATKGYSDVWPPQLEVIGYNAHTGAYMWSFNLTAVSYTHLRAHET